MWNVFQVSLTWSKGENESQKGLTLKLTPTVLSLTTIISVTTAG